MEISLLDDIKAAAEAQAAQRGYADTKAYLESLLSREIERQRAKAALEAQLLEGLDSPAREMTKEDCAQMRRDFEKRLANKRT